MKRKKTKVMLLGRRGQTAGGLIGLIVLLIILYVVLLPPKERAELFREEPVPGGQVPGGLAEAKLLFSASPGRLSFVGQTGFEHVIPNILLAEERQAIVLAESAPFVISRGWFRKNFRNISFTVSEPENIDNVIVSLQVPLNRGRLKVIFNGVSVFEEDIKVSNPKPIKVPKSLLRTGNSIEFQVWGFGLIFPQQYRIEDMKVVGELLDVEKQKSANAFRISESEHENLESAYLGFYPVCDQQSVGTLEIVLNDRAVYSAVPDCEGPGRQELFKEDLVSGRNTLGFRLKSGSARIGQIKVKTFIRPTKGFIDYFTVEPDVFTAMAAGNARAVLEVEFVDDSSLKEARVNVNGRLDVISQRDAFFITDISASVRDGNNFIGIEPLGDIDVASITVRVE
jgi:hypothetical protein